MRRLPIALFFVMIIALPGTAQVLYNSDKVDYTLELPSAAWRVTTEPDAAHEHTEVVFGDRLQGYLQIRKEVVEAGTTTEQLARRDQEQKLSFLPGFVEGKQEDFKGRLNGTMSSYEFVRTGKSMLGRIYYLQVDSRTIYSLRFSGLRDQLAKIRNQTDLIARSFKMK